MKTLLMAESAKVYENKTTNHYSSVLSRITGSSYLFVSNILKGMKLRRVTWLSPQDFYLAESLEKYSPTLKFRWMVVPTKRKLAYALIGLCIATPCTNWAIPFIWRYLR